MDSMLSPHEMQMEPDLERDGVSGCKVALIHLSFLKLEHDSHISVGLAAER